MSAYGQIINSNLQYGLSTQTEVNTGCLEKGYVNESRRSAKNETASNWIGSEVPAAV